MFVWALPECILSAGNSVTVLTCKAKGSLLLFYLSKLWLPFDVVNDIQLEEDFRARAAESITIENIPALSKLKLTYSGQEKGTSSSSYYSKVSRSLKNLKEKKLVGLDINNILITCKKDAWLKACNDSHPKPGVFAKNSRLKDVDWIANTTGGTNGFIHCSHLIYLYDQNINPVIARWLGDNLRAFNFDICEFSKIDFKKALYISPKW